MAHVITTEEELMAYSSECARSNRMPSVEELYSYIDTFAIDQLRAFLRGDASGLRGISIPVYAALNSISYNCAFGQTRVDYCEPLYDFFCNIVRDIFREDVLPYIEKSTETSVLYALHQSWDNLSVLVRWCKKFFNFLDRWIETQSKNKEDDSTSPKFLKIAAFTVKAFYEEVFSKINHTIFPVILSLLEQRRSGETVDVTYVRDCILLYVLMGSASRQQNIGNLEEAYQDTTNLGVYRRQFEEPYLSSLERHYEVLGREWIHALDTSSFLAQVVNILQAEQDTVLTYLHPSSLDPIRKSIIRAMVLNNKEALVSSIHSILSSIFGQSVSDHEMEGGSGSSSSSSSSEGEMKMSSSSSSSSSGSTALISDKDKDTLRNMYTVFDTVSSVFLNPFAHMHTVENSKEGEGGEGGGEGTGGEEDDLLAMMAEALERFMGLQAERAAQEREQEVNEMKAEKKKPSVSDSKLVSTFIFLHQQMDTVLADCFQSNPSFQQHVDQGFKKAVNMELCVYSVNEMIAKYIDNILKGSIRCEQDSEEEKLGHCIYLFNQVRDKDMFAENYREQLANRLLGTRHVNEDLERFVISEIKSRCGNSFTFKIEGMLNDFGTRYQDFEAYSELLSTMDESMRGHGEDGGSTDYEFQVQVLSKSFWPTMNTLSDLPVPPSMQAKIDSFQNFYVAQNDSRFLEWVLSRGELRASCPFGGKTFQVTMIPAQFIVLNLFNERPVWVFGDIAQALNFDDNTIDLLKKIISPFIFPPKTRLLRKNTKSGKLEATDEISLNEKFTSKMLRFPIPSPSLERSRVKEVVNEDRKFAIEAAIVRTMKSRNILPHNELVAEIHHQLDKFDPDSKQIRTAIASLIEREYLRRDDEDMRKYHYVP